MIFKTHYNFSAQIIWLRYIVWYACLEADEKLSFVIYVGVITLHYPMGEVVSSSGQDTVIPKRRFESYYHFLKLWVVRMVIKVEMSSYVYLCWFWVAESWYNPGVGSNNG